MCKLPRLVRTGTEENNGFEVGVFIRVWGQFQHAVTELLHPPNVLHNQFDSLRRQFLCKKKKNNLLGRLEPEIHFTVQIYFCSAMQAKQRLGPPTFL